MTAATEHLGGHKHRTFVPLAGIDRRMWLPVAVVLGLGLFFSFATDSFATVRNFTAVSGQAGTLLIVCLGSTFVILMGSIDLSVGAIVLFVGAASVQLLNNSPIGYGILLAAPALGALLGAINGAVYVFGRIPSFVVTLEVCPYSAVSPFRSSRAAPSSSTSMASTRSPWANWSRTYPTSRYAP